MSNRVKDLYSIAISSGRYSTKETCEISHRILKAITRESEKIGEDLYLSVNELEDAEKMNIMVWNPINLPQGQIVKNDLNYSDEDMVQFIFDLAQKEKEQDKDKNK